MPPAPMSASNRYLPSSDRPTIVIAGASLAQTGTLTARPVGAPACRFPITIWPSRHLGGVMFATLVGAYPRTPLPGNPFRLRAAYGQLERDEVDAAGFRAVQDDLVREVMA